MNLNSDGSIDATTKLGPYYKNAKGVLHSLRVVEYQGPKTTETCFSSESVRTRVSVYALYNTSRGLGEDDEMPQAEVTLMPHAAFASHWDE